MNKKDLKSIIIMFGLIALPASCCLYKENEIINRKTSIIETYGNESKKYYDNSNDYIAGYNNAILRANDYISEMGLSDFREFKNSNMNDYEKEKSKSVTYQNGYEDALDDEYNSYLNVINNKEYEETYVAGYAMAQKMYEKFLEEGCADLFFEQYRDKYKDANVSDSFKKGYYDSFSKLNKYYEKIMNEYEMVNPLQNVDENVNTLQHKTLKK